MAVLTFWGRQHCNLHRVCEFSSLMLTHWAHKRTCCSKLQGSESHRWTESLRAIALDVYTVAFSPVAQTASVRSTCMGHNSSWLAVLAGGHFSDPSTAVNHCDWREKMGVMSRSFFNFVWRVSATVDVLQSYVTPWSMFHLFLMHSMWICWSDRHFCNYCLLNFDI